MEENIAMFSIKAKNEDGSGSKDAKPSSATKEEGFKKARTDTSSQKMTDEEVLSARDLEEAGVVLKDTDWYAGVTRHSNVTVLARIAKHRPIKIIQNICYHKIEEIEFVEVTHGKQAQNHSESQPRSGETSYLHTKQYGKPTECFVPLGWPFSHCNKTYIGKTR
jgi:hypothetical protein